MPANGWIGTMGQLRHALRMFGADTDELDQFLVRGQICTFMGVGGEHAETVVGEDAQFLRDGEWRSVVNALRATSYGLAVNVI